jgi:enoyl-CoA hydratase
MTDAPGAPITTTVEDGVAVVRFDDGKANAVSHAVIDAVHAALDAAEADDSTRAVVLAGRDGMFCAGFHLPTMTESVEAMRSLVGDGARLMARMATCPLPIVAAGTGHALAAGALLLLSCDARVGAHGGEKPAKIGLNEVGIGMALPVFAIALAEERLATDHVLPATLHSRIYDPEGAVAAGYLDEVVPPSEVLPVAVERAKALGQIRRSAYAGTKARLRGPVAERMLATLDSDLGTVDVPST